MNSLIPWILLCYLCIGMGLGWRSIRKGIPHVLATVVAWPLMISGESGGDGPHAPRIHTVFSALEQALQDPLAKELIQLQELEDLKRSLLHVDARIGMVDRLLADPMVAENGEALRRARAKAASELEASLMEVIQLRVQLGLVALAGDTAPVRARMGALSARVRALEELGLVENPAA